MSGNYRCLSHGVLNCKEDGCQDHLYRGGVRHVADAAAEKYDALLAERDALKIERDGLLRHMGAQDYEHNVLALLDLYKEREDALRAENERMRTVLGRIEEWTHQYGVALKPKGADTYGEGMRDAKEQVRAALKGAR